MRVNVPAAVYLLNGNIHSMIVRNIDLLCFPDVLIEEGLLSFLSTLLHHFHRRGRDEIELNAIHLQDRLLVALHNNLHLVRDDGDRVMHILLPSMNLEGHQHERDNQYSKKFHLALPY